MQRLAPHIDLEAALALSRRTLRHGRPDDADRCVLSPQWVVSGDAPSGRAARIALRPGFHLSVYDIKAQTVTEAQSRSEPCVAVVIILAGNCAARFAGGRDITGLRYETGRCYLSHVAAETKGSVAMAPGGRLQLVDLRLSVAFLKTLGVDRFLSELTATHPRCLLQEDAIWLGAAEAANSMMRAATQIFVQALADEERDIQVERAALSVLDDAFRLFASPQAQWEATDVAQKDMLRARRVRMLMANDLSRRWTLNELARAGGVSERGLQDIFHGVYGLPVYACLQRMRLERARVLIECGLHSITSVALSVGYESPSHFASLFKREYGVSPSALKRGA